MSTTHYLEIPCFVFTTHYLEIVLFSLVFFGEIDCAIFFETVVGQYLRYDHAGWRENSVCSGLAE